MRVSLTASSGDEPSGLERAVERVLKDGGEAPAAYASAWRRAALRENARGDDELEGAAAQNPRRDARVVQA